MTVEIRPLTRLGVDDARRLICGYESRRHYEVRKTETAERTEITLELADLSEPFVKRWQHSDEMISWLGGLLEQGLSFGAWSDGRLVGLAIAMKQEWNGTCMVWELHVEEDFRRRGVARGLLEHVEEAASRKGSRVVACETHTPNVDAIAFYRAAGYAMEGIDLSYYTNHDVDRGEVAVFMKKAVRP